MTGKLSGIMVVDLSVFLPGAKVGHDQRLSGRAGVKGVEGGKPPHDPARAKAYRKQASGLVQWP